MLFRGANCTVWVAVHAQKSALLGAVRSSWVVGGKWRVGKCVFPSFVMRFLILGAGLCGWSVPDKHKKQQFV